MPADDEDPFDPNRDIWHGLLRPILILFGLAVVLAMIADPKHAWIAILMCAVGAIFCLAALRSPGKQTKYLSRDRFVLRKASTGLEIIKPGEAYEWKKKIDTFIPIKPEQQLIETSAGPRILRWQADPNRLENYVEFYRPLRSESRALFVAGIKDFFKVNPRPTIEFLQNRHADHFGVKILTLDLPPEAPRVAAPVPPPQDNRSKAEKELDRLFAGVKTAAQARQRWEQMKKNPDFAAALADEQVGSKLDGKYQDLITRIAEGDV